MSDPRVQWQKELEPTPECIDVSRLSDALSERERAHLATCPRCQAELALLHEFQTDSATPDEVRAGQWIASELHRRLALSNNAPSPDAPSNVKPFRSKQRTFSALAAAAVAVLVIGTAVWMENREPSLDPKIDVRNVYRTSRFDVIAPLGDVPEAPRELKWAAVPQATSYTVQILEVDGTELFRGATPRQSIVVPANVIAQFAPGKTLLWAVTARRGSDVLASSETQRFRVSVKRQRRTP